ncbi:hypothetical protein [Nonomuraea turcica]|uniref:hypothetical protein n=1 Tax=Nonomuraea sp. G32 TaxID=3067274 RepID=UPI00273AFD23|nr:hypothetical protein [Nonomuraea sp. G32]MDP4512068.1 hypothetical protein [Nonomuraea sp. G32]
MNESDSFASSSTKPHTSSKTPVITSASEWLGAKMPTAVPGAPHSPAQSPVFAMVSANQASLAAYVGEAPMYDAPILMAKAPANTRRMYCLMNLLPGMKRSTTHLRFRF